MEFKFFKQISDLIRSINVIKPLLTIQGIKGIEIVVNKVYSDNRREFTGVLNFSIDQTNEIVAEVNEINKRLAKK